MFCLERSRLLVKGGFLNIVDKPHLKWHPKHWHIRRIPIPQDLVTAIAERQRKNPGSKLIFLKSTGNTPSRPTESTDLCLWKAAPQESSLLTAPNNVDNRLLP